MMQWRDAVSGVSGAFCCTYAGNPFDVVKVRMQNAGASISVPPGAIRTFGQILRTCGPTAFFGGALPAFASIASAGIGGVVVQKACHRQLAQWHGDPKMRLSMGTECLIGGFSGVFTSIAMCPTEVLKVRMQTGRGRDAGFANCARNVLRTHGMRGFYSGLTSLWMRDIPFNAVFYGSYETLCTAMMRRRGCTSKDQLSTSEVLTAGGLAGSFAWSLVIPCDVVKTQLQSGSATGGAVQVVRQIVAQQGAQGLFRGWTAAVMRGFPANAGFFLGVEYSSRLLKDVHFPDGFRLSLSPVLPAVAIDQVQVDRLISTF